MGNTITKINPEVSGLIVLNGESLVVVVVVVVVVTGTLFVEH